MIERWPWNLVRLDISEEVLAVTADALGIGSIERQSGEEFCRHASALACIEAAT